MKCGQIIELLSPYIDDMTDSQENMSIDAHLAECAKCRRELEYLKLVTTTLGGMEDPQLPEKFNQDFHKRLLEEKSGFFAVRDSMRPKRSGWIAAGLAGVALTVGIYASSFLPIGSFIASFENEPDKKERPKLAIEEIIRSIKGKDTDDNAIKPEVNIADNEVGEAGAPPKLDNNKMDEEAPSQATEPEASPPVVQPRFTKEYAAKVKTTEMDEAVDKVIQIAQANKLEYTLQPNTTNMQALSAHNAKELNIKVEKGKAQQLLKQLGGVGKISNPVENEIEITKEYTHIEEQIFTSNKLIKQLEQKEKLSTAEAKELEDLKTHLQENQSKKVQLDKKLDTVTVKVIIEEEVKP